MTECAVRLQQFVQVFSFGLSALILAVTLYLVLNKITSSLKIPSIPKLQILSPALSVILVAVVVSNFSLLNKKEIKNGVVVYNNQVVKPCKDTKVALSSKPHPLRPKVKFYVCSL